MGRIFRPGKFAGVTSPEVQSMQYATGQTFKIGAVLIYNAGEVVEGGADPTGIVGVAAADAGGGPGFEVNFASRVTATTGRVQEIPVYKANRNTVFSGRLENAGAIVTPTVAIIGTAYGLLKNGNDWVVDQTEVANTRVRIVDIDIPTLMVLFKFLEANLANP